MHEVISALSLPLPEEILRLREAGETEEVMEALESWLKRPLPQMLRNRLLVEQERMRRLSGEYPYTREEVLRQAMDAFPAMTEKDFRQLELEGKISFLMDHGNKRYFVRAVPTLKGDADVRRRFGLKVESADANRDPLMRAVMERGNLRRRLTLEIGIGMKEEAFRPGHYRAWLPLPLERDQQSEVEIEAGDAYIAASDAPQRTAFFEKDLEKPGMFSLKCRYVNTIRYADPWKGKPEVLYPASPKPGAEDLAEDGLYMRFTPYLRQLAAELTQGLKTDLERAWAFYCFVTQQVKYSFVREYFLLDALGEFCAVNLRGDCGLQALLFILLCRISGIPARWQSGLAMDDLDPGMHDWAQFYLSGWGWLFADCSFGGSAFRNGSEERHRFYFGNLDPMRYAAARTFFSEFDPPCRFIRHDPYDNQTGEIELDGRSTDWTEVRRVHRLLRCEEWTEQGWTTVFEQN